MGRASVLAAAVIFPLALAACASNEPGGANTEGASRRPQQCFTASSARSFRAVDTRTVHFRVGRDVYRADVLGTCRDLGWTNRMSLVSSRNSQVCAGLGFGTSIVTRGPGGQQRCAINSIAVLTPEQVEALPAAQRP